jgi:hypothetical protein
MWHIEEIIRSKSNNSKNILLKILFYENALLTKRL